MPQTEPELLQAALDYVAEVGYQRATMVELAQRTNNDVTALHSRWEDKPTLISFALRTYTDERQKLADIDTGTLRGDLRLLAVGVFGQPTASAAMDSIWKAAATDGELLRALREIFAIPGLESLDRILARALARGEIDENNPALVLAESVLFGPLIIQELINGDRPVPELALNIVDHVLMPALTAPPAVSPAGAGADTTP
ncbi:TetR/AcrR family transcriptional regulator C-terminal ligand-binding domain-containing protein [Yinghuangia sp. ASG 101]|uniref:TetR-like C-terminal domain-containing protein n=1 Tax=Yinghuangia sp. ASG 101 TaxID=2896848 RepID=UPI001E39582E|nr:TetR-like C-terminal domain-containing protein [Yinghuangia sp. ASG 101]UGQ11977.1 TetR/AcrR family transcriptional regulator C-terminal ligand-binding domain-containing protein [Yinghuangia sp. ASG 101]